MNSGILYDQATGGVYWWLRSSGQGDNEAADIYMTGIIHSNEVTSPYVAVRPAMWVDLGAKSFSN